MTDRESFWKKVQPLESGCWEWKGPRNAQGYGRARTADGFLASHRWAYGERVGFIPPGMFVLHRCDNPPCVNPDHLFLGTQRDNIRDMIAKGRAPDRRATRYRGERHHSAILNEARVAEIRRLRAEGLSKWAIAARTGISPTTVYRTIVGKTWIDRKSA